MGTMEELGSLAMARSCGHKQWGPRAEGRGGEEFKEQEARERASPLLCGFL